MVDDRLRRHVWILGRVQNVLYRETARQEAELYEVGGWVKNTTDGGVEAVFEGPSRGVELMLRWARRGPPMAQVSTVRVKEEPPKGEHMFRVIR